MNLTELMDCIPHLREILHIVVKAFEDCDDPAHDISHTLRVVENVSEIAFRERCDLNKAIIAALLHDIKRPQEALTGIDHAESGAEYALGLLPTMGFDFSFISEVSQAIRSHRYSGGLTPASVTGKILQDADRLDAIGAVAIARVFSYSGKVGTPLHSLQFGPWRSYSNNSSSSINHFHEKILKIRPETFWTETARRMAGDRYSFVVEFVQRFMAEWGEI
ncbi:MAG TPA: HD domain-containing protein [Mesotoga infera]|uniref:HD domain-containing protein n=1 Tax=Mesotoga infera TaxID=1236046 RepID=A0A7C1H9H9_9BACT|nr:HD domain-containing protein [Mesotoga infera]